MGDPVIYDPDVAPLPAAWLAMSDASRRTAAALAHEGPPDALHPPHLPRGLHFGLHAAAETLLAQDHAAALRTLTRMTEQGVRRHAVLHMVMDVLARHLARAGEGFDEGAFAAALDALDAGAWIGQRMREDLGDPLP